MSYRNTDSVTEIEPANRPGLVLPPDIGLAEVAERLVDQARADGIALTGQGGLLTVSSSTSCNHPWTSN